MAKMVLAVLVVSAVAGVFLWAVVGITASYFLFRKRLCCGGKYQ